MSAHPSARAALPSGAAYRSLHRERRQAAWLVGLPREWRPLVVAPLDLVEHRDYEVAAARCLGYDGDGALCHYAHGYALDELRSDDDEAFYRVVVYSETVRAWRLRDQRWLVYRIVHRCGDGAPGRGFYSFAERCPDAPLVRS